MNLSEKAAYLKGLKDGMKLDTESNEGKLLDGIIDLLGDIAASVTDIEDMHYDVSEELDAIEDELDAIEETLDGEYEDDDSDDDEYGDEEDDEDYDFGDGTIYEVKCPTCGEIINIDEDMLEEGSIECPSCGEDLEFDTTEVND